MLSLSPHGCSGPTPKPQHAACTARRVHATLLLLAALALALPARSSARLLAVDSSPSPPVSDPCESLTGIAGCIECARPRGAVPVGLGSLQLCYLCERSRVPVLDEQQYIAACKPALTGGVCAAATGDPNCWRCHPDNTTTCVQCKLQYSLDPNSYKVRC